MSRYCLDTSAYSFFNRGDPAVVEIIDSADWLGFPAVTLGELETGFLLGNRRRANQGILREFLENSVVEEIAIDHAIGGAYAEMVVALRRAGTPVPTNDIWIAATAVRTRSTVLTYDRHFELIPQADSVVLSQSRS